MLLDNWMAEKLTIRGKLVAKQDGVYRNYVFQNLDESDTSLYKYITVTICPNWQNVERMNIGDTGFLTAEYVTSGEIYVDKLTGEETRYKNTAIYFINFIKDNKEIQTKEYNF